LTTWILVGLRNIRRTRIQLYLHLFNLQSDGGNSFDTKFVCLSIMTNKLYIYRRKQRLPTLFATYIWTSSLHPHNDKFL